MPPPFPSVSARSRVVCAHVTRGGRYYRNSNGTHHSAMVGRAQRFLGPACPHSGRELVRWHARDFGSGRLYPGGARGPCESTASFARASAQSFSAHRRGAVARSSSRPRAAKLRLRMRPSSRGAAGAAQTPPRLSHLRRRERRHASASGRAIHQGAAGAARLSTCSSRRRGQGTPRGAPRGRVFGFPAQRGHDLRGRGSRGACRGRHDGAVQAAAPTRQSACTPP
mmetsp:Transcript_5237/g.13786  ORF Transcript_5237/g.13786 Transcript_5237/m.13786 type:complete len:225 (+) Transcript_5237:523-1197(+)